MLLALDAGNTNITLGVFDGDKVVARWRLRTVHEQTADEWGVLIGNLFELSKISMAGIDGVIIGSVVPAVDQPLAAMSERYFGQRPLFVTGKTDTGIVVRYDNPMEVGADRIVNAAAAYAKYGGPAIVVDLGTAITFDAVSANAEYLGGVISPGIGIAISGLYGKTARLPMVDFREPEKLIGSNTVGSIQSGLYYGFVSLIDGIVERMMAELGPGTKAIATGGQGPLIVRGSKFVKVADDDLTLEGLRLIWNRNQER